VSPRFLLPLLVGLAAAAAMVFGIFYVQRDAHVELKGGILKVRTQGMDETSSVVVIDFRFVNPSAYPFIVRKVDVYAVTKDGSTLEGQPVAEADAKRLFQYFPLLGQKFNDTLLMRDRIDGRQSQDRMIAARFEKPVKELEQRQQLVVRIEDVDGPVSELREK
jgi:hypothetical protein